MHKKAQFSLFAILGIVIIVIVALLFWDDIDTYAAELGENFGRSENEQEQYDNLDECLSLYGKQGLEYIEAQGGYLQLPRESIALREYSLAFFSRQGVQQIQLKDIEEDLAQYIAEQTEEVCFQNTQEKWSIDFPSGKEVQATFTEDALEIFIDWPVSFRSTVDPSERFTLHSYGIKIKTHFHTLYEQAERMQNDGLSLQEEYFTNSMINSTIFAQENITILLLNQEEEYFIIGVEK